MAIWERLRWPLLWAATALCVAKDCNNHTDIVGIEGEDIVLSPQKLATGNLTGISWKKGENLVADSRFAIGKENQRMRLDSSSGKLFLKNLSQQDSGNYTAEAFFNEKIMETCLLLKVLVLSDINCTVNNDSIQLNCTSASQGLPLSYTWDYLRLQETENRLPVIQLPRNVDRFQKITCFVSASGSAANKSINLSDCIPEEPDHQSRNRIYLILPAILIIVLFCWPKVKNLGKKKKSETLSESESGPKNIRENHIEEISELPEEERKSLAESSLELESVAEKKREGEGEEGSSLSIKARDSLSLELG